MLTASSEVFTDGQLDQMKIDGWDVLPDNATAEVIDDLIVDKMYTGFCGPSQDITANSKSPLLLFYCFLPKVLWRHVATHTNLYWQQTLEARLEKAMEK
jgi:hypothetical protein